ncbi:hypothetical protein MTO96_021422 [Rhipicephalus appendiculatus]
MISLALSFVLASLAALSSAVTHPPARLLQTPMSTRRQLYTPHNASHVLPEDRRLEQRGQNRLFVDEGDDESGPAGPLPSHRLPESSKVVISGGLHSRDRVVATDRPDETTSRVDLHEFFRTNQPIEVFPGRLLDLCNQDAPLTFHVLLPNGRQHHSKWLAHGRHSEVFRVASLLRRTVLKVVPVTGDFTDQEVDTIVSAIECCLKLSALKHGMTFRAPNFIEVERIVCVFDQFPEWLLRSGTQGLDSSNESLAESLASEMAGVNQCCLTRHFIVFELCYAGKPLSRISLRSAVQGRSLVQQAACCVAVAERALGFRHTGVDADKLLVAVTDAASLEYRLPDRTTPISIESAGLKAHLAGCLSFDIDSAENTTTPAFRGNADDSPASNYSGSGTPRFYGNVMWLGAVMDSMVNKLRSEVPESRARAERAVLEELLSWQAQLQQCNSADEFVATLGL